jgi:60 kDa SS-A/Ro ribonucleoprotein
MLDRFLILGSDKPTYYCNARDLTVKNANNIMICIKEDSVRVVNAIVDVRRNGRAPKADPAIYALALVCTEGDEKGKKAAYNAIQNVCRIGTDILMFTKYIKDLRGWSRGLRNGVNNFYLNKPLEKLELQLVKYKNRHDFTHRDVMRLTHPSTNDAARNSLFSYAVNGDTKVSHRLIEAEEALKKCSSVKEAVRIITDTRAPREIIPTNFLNSPEVWEALLVSMPITALIRNLGKMSSVGLLNSGLAEATKMVVAKLTNPEIISRGRVHPMNVLQALAVYNAGKGIKGSLRWSPISKISNALDDAFYLSFKAVEPTGKNVMVALDVSGSMSSGINGSFLSCREAAAAMAMTVLRTEQNYDIIGFTSGGSGYMGGKGRYGMWNYGVSKLNIHDRMSIKDVVRYTSRLGFGGTDCALPMIYAEKNKIPVDVFQVYTDCETWAGGVHPFQALKSYRQKMGRPAKLVVQAVTATDITIADPSDKGMIDIVGLDSAAPSVIRNFILEEI